MLYCVMNGAVCMPNVALLSLVSGCVVCYWSVHVIPIDVVPHQVAPSCE